jgi:hypothetical protein
LLARLPWTDQDQSEVANCPGIDLKVQDRPACGKSRCRLLNLGAPEAHSKDTATPQAMAMMIGPDGRPTI